MTKLIAFIRLLKKAIKCMFEFQWIMDKLLNNFPEPLHDLEKTIRKLDACIKEKKVLVGEGFSIFYVDQSVFFKYLLLTTELDGDVLLPHLSLLSVIRSLSFSGYSIFSVKIEE